MKEHDVNNKIYTTAPPLHVDDIVLCSETPVKPQILYSSRPKIRERARSASFRIHRPSSSERDVEEQKNLGNLVKEKLSRTLSLRWDKDQRSVGLGTNLASAQSSPDFTPENEVPEMAIGANGIRRGPGQVFSRKIKLSDDTLGDIKLGFLITKGQLEVQVICARELSLNPSGQPPDTYVKTYLKQGERQMQKRKTRVVRHSSEPQYRQTLKYNALDTQGRRLLVMVWERQKGFEHNQPIGAVEIQLDRLDFSRLMFCWYPLYPILHVDVESNEST
ncbi:protein piccolo-like [Limulus polyphemus]|uniref:Protein piccolo-like n=1 Tax=Limulus polyphemus TaxID=6850 RepID=A0ABM1THQ7_LIMPO|nr:protein piccolo-like [Limulus polyphemus]